MLIGRILRSALAVLMFAMVTVVFAQVVLRYLTYQPVAWTEEIARIVFIWLCLVGAAEAGRRSMHFAVDLLPRSLSGVGGRLLRGSLKLAESILYSTVAWAGYQILSVVHGQESVTLAIPMSFAYAAIPFGMGLMAIFALLSAKNEFQGKRPSQ